MDYLGAKIVIMMKNYIVFSKSEHHKGNSVGDRRVNPCRQKTNQFQKNS